MKTVLGLLIRMSCCFLLLFVLPSCSKEQPTLPKLKPGAVILAYGDSLTYGTGVKQTNAYPAVLSRLTGMKVINAGVPGETTKQSLIRLPQVLNQYHPNLVILCIGGNDLLRRLPKKVISQNINQLIQMIKNSGASVVLIGVPAPGFMLRVPEFYQSIATRYDIPFEDDTLRKLIGDVQYKSDPIHLNKKGYDHLAQAIFQVLKNAGAIEN